MTATTLIVMRHAKSSWNSAADSDFDRPLAERGTRDARRMGEWLAGRGREVDRIVSSPALRTRQTVELLLAGWRLKSPPELVWEPSLYLAEVPTILRIVEQALPQALLVVGHNPGLEDLIDYLVADLAQQIEQPKALPTGAIYVLGLGVDGTRIEAGSARLLEHARPKLLGEAGGAKD